MFVSLYIYIYIQFTTGMKHRSFNKLNFANEPESTVYSRTLSRKSLVKGQYVSPSWIVF